MAIPEGYVQMNLYLPAETLKAVDDAAREQTGRKNGRSDWIRDAIGEKLGNEKDKRLTAIDAAFESMNDAGRDAMATFADMARSYKPYKR